MGKNLEKELAYLGKQNLWWEYLDEIKQIRDEKFTQRELNMGSTLYLSVNCFLLGVIIGKKIERAKKKALIC